MIEFIEKIFQESRDAHQKFTAESAPVLELMAKAIARCFVGGGKLLIFGNGGSAADAQHLAAEFVNRFKMERPPLPALALTTDTSVLTAIGNDYDYAEVFAKQVLALAQPGDVVWGLTTSGNSENVVRGLRAAAKAGIKTIGFSGRDGGKMAGLCDILLNVPWENTPRIQEMHILGGHIICELVDELMFGSFAAQMFVQE